MLAVTRAPRHTMFLAAVAALALAHVVVLGLHFETALASNSIQFLAAIFAVALSLLRAFRSPDPFFRRSWAQLAGAFAIWAAAQFFFLFSLLVRGTSPNFPSPADFLWLMFAFPVLLVTVQRRTWAHWEWVHWLDTAQACLFFSVLYVLVFSHPAVLSVAAVYDVQSAALLLACVLRYSSTPPGSERTFFRNVGAYLLAYGILSSIGNRNQPELPSQGWVDLCWSLPPLLFCTLVLLTPSESTASTHRRQSLKIGLPTHLHGLSALGLTFLSIAAATTLESARPRAGLATLVVSLLLFAIRTSVRESQLQGAHESLQHSAFHDSLTGLGNRTQLLDELTSRLHQTSSRVGVLIVDIDRFKTINDSLGHPFGDRLLIEIASLLRSAVRADDLVVRLGGDEFVVLMDCNGSVTPEQLASNLVRRFRQPVSLEGRVLYLTASVGVVLGEPGQDPDDLLRDADCAMYEAKKRGKNQEQTFQQHMVRKATEELLLEQDLRQAIHEGGLLCFYQPIFSLNQQDIVGFEALSRWNHPTRGMVPPCEFIPIAEETGLIIELGKEVFRQAFQQIHDWNRSYNRRFSISVNVSPRQFADPNLLAGIYSILLSTGLDPTLLKLEITESALLSGIDSVEEVLNGARALGIQISLDDFGTGYSSLSYLLRLPFDVVKIDRSFVQALDRDPKRAQLVRTIVDLARTLEKAVIAEGVETVEERDWLANMNCDLLQGYFFSKPLPAEAVARLLHPQVFHFHPLPGTPHLLGSTTPPSTESLLTLTTRQPLAPALPHWVLEGRPSPDVSSAPLLRASPPQPG